MRVGEDIGNGLECFEGVGEEPGGGPRDLKRKMSGDRQEGSLLHVRSAIGYVG